MEEKEVVSEIIQENFPNLKDIEFLGRNGLLNSQPGGWLKVAVIPKHIIVNYISLVKGQSFKCSDKDREKNQNGIRINTVKSYPATNKLLIICA